MGFGLGFCVFVCLFGFCSCFGGFCLFGVGGRFVGFTWFLFGFLFVFLSGDSISTSVKLP